MHLHPFTHIISDRVWAPPLVFTAKKLTWRSTVNPHHYHMHAENYNYGSNTGSKNTQGKNTEETARTIKNTMRVKWESQQEDQSNVLQQNLFEQQTGLSVIAWWSQCRVQHSPEGSCPNPRNHADCWNSRLLLWRQSPDIQSPDLQTETGHVPAFIHRNKMLINIQVNIMFVTCPVSCLFVFF